MPVCIWGPEDNLVLFLYLVGVPGTELSFVGHASKAFTH